MLNCSMRMSHNAAFVCEAGRLVAYGSNLAGSGLGIMRSVSSHSSPSADQERSADWTAMWSQPFEVISMSQESSGCIEKRVALTGKCDFDGKLSTFLISKRRMLLYSRANTARKDGRYVQVAIGTRSTPAADSGGNGGWSFGRFQLVRIQGVEPSAATNIYFFTVAGSTERSQHSGDRDDDGLSAGKLVSTFPMTVNRTSALYTAWSDDGVNWSAPMLLLPSGVREVHALTTHSDWAKLSVHNLEAGRLPHEPIDGGLTLGRAHETATILVLHGVNHYGDLMLQHGVNTTPPAIPFVCQYVVPLHRIGLFH